MRKNIRIVFLIFYLFIYGCGKIDKSLTSTATIILSSITINPQSATLQIGETFSFNAVGRDNNGLVVSISPVWSVTPAELGIIGNTGIFTAKIIGTGEITAEYSNIKGKTVVVINEGPPANLYSIEISPSNPTINIGGTQLFIALGFDKNHQPVSFTPIWSAAGGGVIDQSGRFTAQVPGPGKITASAGKIKGETTVFIAESLPEI